jgi:adenosylhomocysteinase
VSETPRFEQLAPSAIEDPGLADEGARVLEWTRRNMPLLHRLRAEFARARPLDGRRIGMCLHVEAKTGVLGPTPSGS